MESSYFSVHSIMILENVRLIYTTLKLSPQFLTTNPNHMEVQKIKIIETKPYGYIVKNLSTKMKQLIPKDLLLKRMKWGIYEILNPAMLAI